MLWRLATLAAGATPLAAAAPCSFCAGAAPHAKTFDLSALSTKTYELGGAWPNGSAKAGSGYSVSSPCRGTNSGRCGASTAPMQQGCKPLGHLQAGGPNSTLVNLTERGFSVTLRGGFDVPHMTDGRNAVFDFVCDEEAAGPAAGPEPGVVEQPPGFYTVTWKTQAACKPTVAAKCGPLPPAPAPLPPPASCMPGADVCLPSWKPSWNLTESTVLYTCNNSEPANRASSRGTASPRGDVTSGGVR